VFPAMFLVKNCGWEVALSAKSCQAKPKSLSKSAARPTNYTQLNFLGVTFSDLNLFFKIN